MTQHASWIVEYSLSKNKFYINELSKVIEDNLRACIIGIPTDHLLIGIFAARETALIFCEGFQRRLLAFSQPIATPFDSLEQAVGNFVEYKQVIELLQNEFKHKPYGFIKEFCQQKGLTYNTLISFIRNKITYPTPNLLFRLLVAFDYQVRMRKVIYAIGRDTQVLQEDVSYYFKKVGKSSETIRLP